MNKSENIIKQNIEDIKEQIRQGKDLSEIYDEMKDSVDVDFDEFKIICKKIYNENKTNLIKQEQPQNINKINKKEAWEIRPAFNFVSFITNDMWAKTKILLAVKFVLFFISIIMGITIVGKELIWKTLTTTFVVFELLKVVGIVLLGTMPFYGFIFNKFCSTKEKANKYYSYVIYFFIVVNTIFSLLIDYKDFKDIEKSNKQQTQQSTSKKNEETDLTLFDKTIMEQLFVGEWHYEKYIHKNKIIPIFEIFTREEPAEVYLSFACKKPKNNNDFGFVLYILKTKNTEQKQLKSTIFYNTNNNFSYKKINLNNNDDVFGLSSNSVNINKKNKTQDGPEDVIEFTKDLLESNKLILNYELDNQKRTSTFNTIGFKDVFDELYQHCYKDEEEEDSLIQNKLNQLEQTNRNNFQKVNKSNYFPTLNIELKNLVMDLRCFKNEDNTYSLASEIKEKINNNFIDRKIYVKIKNHWEEIIFYKKNSNIPTIQEFFEYKNNSIEPQEFKRRQNLTNIVEHLKYNNKLLLATKINDNFYLDELDLSSIRKELEPVLNQCN